MHAQIHQLQAVGKVVNHKVPRRLRQHHLTAVRRGAQPGAAIDRRAEVVDLIPQLRLRSVHGYSHLQRHALRPTLGDEGSLDIQRGGQA